MISVVVVNWNGWQDTLRAYESLVASTHADWEMIIVDNASSDESVERLRQLANPVTLIENTTNEGFAGGCNIGVQAAIANGAKHIFLLNNDATVHPTTLSLLVDNASSEGDVILGCVVRYRETGQLQYFGSRTNPLSGGPDWHRVDRDLWRLTDALIPTDFVFGAALFCDVSIFKKVGMFDERFFLTFEETDWCYRARALGIPCFVVRDALVDHAGSASLGPSASPLQAYFLQRNRLLFYEKHAGCRLLLSAMKGAIVRMMRKGERSEHSNEVDEETACLKAIRWAFRDYCLRRFGDCPEEVRALMRRASN